MVVYGEEIESFVFLKCFEFRSLILFINLLLYLINEII